MSLSETGNAISQAIYFVIDVILEIVFIRDGLVAVLGFLTIFVAFVLMWAWTQHLITETALKIRERSQRRNGLKDTQDAQMP